MPHETYRAQNLRPYPALCDLAERENWLLELRVERGKDGLTLLLRDRHEKILASHTSRLPAPNVFRELASKVLAALIERGLVEKKRKQ